MTARMRNMSKEYKRLAVAKQIPIILISSATPDSSAASDEPPMIEQVAWSKQLAYDADLAFAVHKHDDSNLIQVACRKNRNGPLFSGFLNWDIDNGIIKEEF
jgi:replicative DNA helicase